ncbi:MAG: hypothetical protein SF187_19205 [Deltaproteobacteria bacterium]|nr:hypothetical protein [Deltaproteobacteria bacterium]
MAFSLLGLCPLSLVQAADLASPNPEAIALYARANEAFEARDYSGAAAALGEAVKLDSNPLLIFNLAQALRLGGKCKEALFQYREFITKAAPELESSLRDQAERYAKTLTAECDSPPAERTELLPTLVEIEKADLATPVPALSIAKDSASTSQSEQPRSRSWAKAALVFGGATVGLGGGGFLWNRERYARWSNTDQFLQAQKAAGVTTSELVDKQRSNDGLLNSVRTFNVVTLTAMALGAAAAICSVLYMARPSKKDDASP